MKDDFKLTTNLYALLIGIDCYLPNRLPDGSFYKTLKGCVRDINSVEIFLNRQPKPPNKIIKLIASNQEEIPDVLPNYENIVAKFKEITHLAQPGDRIYIHYSGHGGRAKTNYPQLKGENGIDEVLVPVNIGNPNSRYLRDLELAKIIDDMVQKGLVLTVVMDCCHSGGVTRVGGAEIRGLNADKIDTTQRPTDSLVAPVEELVKTWQNLTKIATRQGNINLLPYPKDYVLLAACRPSELAYEYTFDGKEHHGALTYWLLDTLNQGIPELNYKSLHDRIYAKVRSQFVRQTPMLLGEENRLVFGNQIISSAYAVTVLEVELDENTKPQRIKLDAGQAQGVNLGATFVIYPLGTKDFTQVEQRLAIAKIVQRKATESWAEIPTIFGDQKFIESGAQAVLTSAPVSLVKKVGLMPDNFQNGDKFLQKLALAMAGNGWVELALNNETAHYQVTMRKIQTEEEANRYQVAVNEWVYEICDRTGFPIILKPGLNVNNSNAATNLVKRLIHLAKYQAIQELDNIDPKSPLQGKVSVNLLGKQANYKLGEPISPQPFEDPTQPTVSAGECVFLEIQNNYSNVLNLVILDLQSNWAIDQLYPPSTKSQFVPLDPGQTELIPIELSLPEGEARGADILKVFVTLDAANFRWLELPALDQPIIPANKRKINAPSNSLEELLAILASEQPATRQLIPVAFPSREWMTTQVVVNVIN